MNNIISLKSASELSVLPKRVSSALDNINAGIHQLYDTQQTRQRIELKIIEAAVDFACGVKDEPEVYIKACELLNFSPSVNVEYPDG